jgi:hypothetical protein
MASNREKPSILVVASPTPLSGGLREHRSLKEYTKHFNTHLFVPWGCGITKKLCKNQLNTLWS